MESFNNLKSFHKNPLVSVSCVFKNTTIDPLLLSKYLKSLQAARSLEDLQSQIIASSRKLDLLNAFTKCKVEVGPGLVMDSAVINFYLVDKSKFAFNIGANSDPFQLNFLSKIRNINHRPNETGIAFGFNPQTKNTTFELKHSDKLTVPDVLKLEIKAGKYLENLDINLEEKKYGLATVFQSFDNKHAVEIGREIRSNTIQAEFASVELIKRALIPTEKNYIRYSYLYSSLSGLKTTGSAWVFKAHNELAIGENLSFHKISSEISHYFDVSKEVLISNSLEAGFFVPWGWTKYHVNDAFRYQNFSGFHHIGRREKPFDKYLADKIEVPGDNLGQNSKISLQTSLILKNFPFLAKFRISPFFYLSSAYIHEKPDYKQNIRGSIGFGLKWFMSIGVLEFIYSAKFIKQEGDKEAEFQIIFKEKE